MFQVFACNVMFVRFSLSPCLYFHLYPCCIFNLCTYCIFNFMYICFIFYILYMWYSLYFICPTGSKDITPCCLLSFWWMTVSMVSGEICRSKQSGKFNNRNDTSKMAPLHILLSVKISEFLNVYALSGHGYVEISMSNKWY